MNRRVIQIQISDRNIKMFFFFKNFRMLDRNPSYKKLQMSDLYVSITENWLVGSEFLPLQVSAESVDLF